MGAPLKSFRFFFNGGKQTYFWHCNLRTMFSRNRNSSSSSKASTSETVLALCVAESRLTTQKYDCMTQRQSFLSSSRILLSTFVTFSKTRQDSTGSHQPISRLLFSLWQNFLQNNPVPASGITWWGQDQDKPQSEKKSAQTNRCWIWSPDVLEQLSFLTFGCPLLPSIAIHFSCGCGAVLKAWIFRKPQHWYFTSVRCRECKISGNRTAKWRSTTFKNRWIDLRALLVNAFFANEISSKLSGIHDWSFHQHGAV